MSEEFRHIKGVLNIQGTLSNGQKINYILSGKNKNAFLKKVRKIFKKYENVNSDPPDRSSSIISNKHRIEVSELISELKELLCDPLWLMNKVNLTMEGIWIDIEDKEDEGFIQVEAGSGKLGLGGRWTSY